MWTVAGEIFRVPREHIEIMTNISIQYQYMSHINENILNVIIVATGKNL